MKKILCFIMSIIVIATFSISTNAGSFDNADNLTVTGSHSEDDLFCDDFYYHILDDGTAEITDYVGVVENLLIPESLNGQSVCAIGRNAFFNNHNLKTIEIPDSVTIINYWAFESCANLEQVYIGNGLQYIANGAFNDCKNLEAVYVDTQNSFYSSVDGVLYNKNTKVLVKYPPASLNTEVQINESVTQIGCYAFDSCENIEEIIIPTGVTHIFANAFQNCPNLLMVNIPQSIVFIGSSAFDNCPKLNRIDINDLVLWCNIDFECFIRNSSTLYDLYLNGVLLTDVVIPDSHERINDYTFKNCKSVIRVSLHDGISSLGECCFSNCINLKYINVPNSVTEIGSCAFYNCNNLESINIPNNLSAIENQVFAECTHLKTAIIPNSITSIGGGAFENCTSIKEITIPESVLRISGGAFSGCSNIKSVNTTNLTSWCNINFSMPLDNPLCYAHDLYLNGVLINEIILPDGVQAISDYAFYSCSMETISIPKDVVSIGKHTFVNCDRLKAISVDENSSKYKSINGCLYDKEMSTIIKYPAMKAESSFTLPVGVKEIAESAFHNCTNLIKIELPNSIEDIFPYAFLNCTNLQKVNLPEGLLRIDYMAFAYCSSLREITIPSTIEMFGGHGFVFGDCTGLEKVSFSEGLRIIGAYAFGGCTNLNEVIIPKSIERIGSHAFLDCKSITDVYYGGSEKDWYKIVGNSYAFDSQITKAEHETEIHYAEESNFLLGDSDGDDSVTIVDATVIQRHLAEIPTAVYIEAAADADQDGSVTIIDATCIQRWLAELPTHEGIGEIFV